MKHADLTERIIGAFFDVYNKLGYGFLESVYENAMMIALSKAGLQCESQSPIRGYCEGKTVGDFREAV